MLGLKQFSTPQFYIPQVPQTERPLHKAKDLMSFLNSLQWKADEEEDDSEQTPNDANVGLDPNLNSGNDTSLRIGSTRWDGMDSSQLWEQARDSLVTGENPTTKGYSDKIGMTPTDVKFDTNEGLDNRRGAEATAAGLIASLNSGHDTSRRVGSTSWDGMNDSNLWEQAMDSIVTGENPITKGYSEKIGITPGKSRFVGWTPAELQDYLNSPMTR